ncbi:fructosamine kinase family protein [uncultured Croceicoccus sp.]|uniref:fructosamine kinase family protein n=1 Tax=uncultured Croceicoccus sp. TaxID=1295329 RepID=UPI0026065694|nr:fructosamine kinase family protein [uncultured Croceicoccus sp.]
MSMPERAVARLLGQTPAEMRPLSGGDLSAVFCVTMPDGASFVAKQAGNVAAEADMLRRMGRTGVRVPDVVACEGEWMILSHEDGTGRLDGGAWDDLAAQLSLLHRPVDERYGWDRDHAFGAVGIANARCDDWPQFWAERRLRPHLSHVDTALGDRIAALCARIGDVLPARPDAALLHGDLWGGNVMVGGDGACTLIDPACHIGHREVDWAMLTLFNAPPDRFFDAMEPEPGWRARLGCYRLWPLLVHLRLFGASYRVGVERELSDLGA